MTIHSFNPPPRTLMGPGPADVHPRVLAALARPTVGHLDPAFVSMMEELKILLRAAFRTQNALTMPVSAPGSAGMEICFLNLVEPGDEVVVCVNGVFGGRMKENVERAGGTPIVVQGTWGRAVDPAQVEDSLRLHPQAKILAFVHAETSTGASSDAKLLADIAQSRNCLTIVDAVTSLGGTPVEVDAWGLDAVYSGSQKCLSCTPGLAPVTFSERALQKVRARQSKVRSWFLDLNLIMGYWNGEQRRTYHHTAPVNALYALHESLVMLAEEGLEQAWRRHRHHHLALRAGLETLGLELIVPEAERLPQLNSVAVPAGIDEACLRARLLQRYGLEIGAGLGDLAGQIWRIGLMGYSSRPANILLCLSALAAELGAMGLHLDGGAALAAARAVLDQRPEAE